MSLKYVLIAYDNQATRKMVLIDMYHQVKNLFTQMMKREMR